MATGITDRIYWPNKAPLISGYAGSIIVPNFPRLRPLSVGLGSCPLDIATLAAGETLPQVSYVLDAASVEAYRNAVEDGSLLYREEPKLVPPMAVAALALRGLLEALSMPPGTIHAGQELTFSQALPVGAQVSCNLTIAQNSVRGEWRFVTVEISVTQQEREVLRGKTTLLVPVE